MALKISWDGLLYLLSAMSLFGPKMGEQYQWIREPGYPLFIRLLYNYDENFRNIIIFQSLIVSISVILLTLFYFFHVKSRFIKFAFLVAGVLSFIYSIGYASWVLQQALFIGLTSLHVTYIWINENSKINSKKFILSSMSLLFITGLFSLILLPASLITVWYVFGKNSKKTKIALKSKSLALLAILIPVIIFNSTWTMLKISKTSGINRLYSDPIFLTAQTGDQNYSEAAYLLPANVLGVLGIGFEKTSTLGEVQNSPAGSQFFFSFNNSRGGLGCGTFDGGPQPVVDYLDFDWENYSFCNNSVLLDNFHTLTRSLEKVFPILIFIPFLGLVFLLGRGNTIFTESVMFPIASILPYLFEPTISVRYGLPFIFISPFLLVLTIFSIFKKEPKNLVEKFDDPHIRTLNNL